MLVFGSRGALVSVLFFILISILVYIQYKKQKTMYIFVVSLSFVFIILLSSQIIELITHILNVFGVSSRNLLLISSSNFLYDSNRFVIWKSILNDFLQNPFIIRGINSDYFVQTGLSTADYSHNLFIEIFHSFGMVFGFIFSAFIIARVVKTFNFKTDNYSMVKLVFLSGFFPLLLWSGSIWTNSSFWFWLSFRKPTSKKLIQSDKRTRVS
jgi:hypothetical protein